MTPVAAIDGFSSPREVFDSRYDEDEAATSNTSPRVEASSIVVPPPAPSSRDDEAMIFPI